MSLQKYTAELSEVHLAQNALHKSFHEGMDKLIATENQLKEYLNMESHGIDSIKIRDARQVISIQGEFKGEREQSGRFKLLNDAIVDMSTGYKHLSKNYYGMKNYSGFGDQRHDTEYGYGPKHGHIVFDVRLLVRARELTEQEVELALYYLYAFRDMRIPKAEAA